MSITVAVDAAQITTVSIPDELTFVDGLPGMGNLTRFALTPLDTLGFLFAMRSVDAPSIRLFVISAKAYFADYNPETSDATRAALGLSDGEPLALAVVHPGGDFVDTTVNLLAPVMVNVETGAAQQAVLDGDWSMRTPLKA